MKAAVVRGARQPNHEVTILKQIDTLIIGATALAYPLAARLGGAALVVESGFSVGAEFSEAMIAERVKNAEHTGLAGEICAELEKRGILLPDGRIHILAVGGALAGKYLETGAEILLGTAVTDISRVQDGFIATLFGAENGYEQIAAKRVVDTRTREFMDCRKVFGLMLAGEKDMNVWSDDKSFVEHGVFDDEYILHLYVDRDSTIPDCEKYADEWLKTNRSRIGNARVAGITLVFGYRFAEPVREERDGIIYVPSASYPDVISAVRGGEELCL